MPSTPIKYPSPWTTGFRRGDKPVANCPTPTVTIQPKTQARMHHKPGVNNHAPFFRWILSGLLFLSFSLQAQKSTLFDQLNYQEVVDLHLAFDFEQLEENRKNDDYQDAYLSFTRADQQIDKLELKVRVRGKYRRHICDFPPLMLNFDKGELEERGLKKDDKLKLVTHCMDSKEAEENILREYLTYQLYSIITPLSYRTQLVKVVYQDTKSKRKTKGWGILLEDEETIEDRLDGKVCDTCYSVPKIAFEQQNLHIASVFQYMVGNADWSVPMIRNLKLINCQKEGKFYVVPYDFDFCGLVNAGYAVPNQDYQLSSVQDRVFLGLAESDQELHQCFDFFRSKKPELLAYVDQFELLSKRSRKEITLYIESFYEDLENGIVTK